MGTTDRQRDEVAAGIKFTLMAGDFAVFPPNTPGEVRNDGTGPTVALVAVVEPFGNEAAPVATPPA